MKSIVILGGGTAGTMVANHLVKRLGNDASVRVVDPSPSHLYQPGLLFIPFGSHSEGRIERPRADTFHDGVDWVQDAVKEIDPEGRKVVLASGRSLGYDLLVIASGSRIVPEETPGMLGDHYGVSVHNFYTLEGALKLRDALDDFAGGRLVINVVEMPIKCPVAPLEFAFLADDYFQHRGLRNAVEIVYATPLDGAFTKPVASQILGGTLADRDIHVEPLFSTGEVDGPGRVLRSYDEREIPYDLLVSVPTHMGAEFVSRSGLGDELGFVPTDHHTLKSTAYEDIFVLGDATNLPSSKAGSVAHFQSDIMADNLVSALRGQPLEASFDGHANCFVETGAGKAFLIDFNYDVQPLPGRYPLPGVGPFSLLEESRVNHLGKLGFEWLYWNALLPGHPLPVPNHMSMLGKHVPAETLAG
jgi:sulfide:quinone oxidoreductase